MPTIYRSQLLCGGPIIMASNVQQQYQQNRRTRQKLQRHQHQQQQKCFIFKKNQACNSFKQLNQHHPRPQHDDNDGIKNDRADMLLEGKWQHLLPNEIIKSCRLLHFGNIAIWLQLLVLLTWNGGSVAYAEGNVGCNFVSTLCLRGSEVCFNDNIFGKCIPTTGVDLEDIERTPLREEDSRMLARMLEEMQGAGLGWDHPYVQCRIQGTLFSVLKRKQLPPQLCANLAPAPHAYDPSGTLAFVRFTQPGDDSSQRKRYNLHKARGLPSHEDVQKIFFDRVRSQNNERYNDDVEHFYRNVLNVRIRPSLINDMIANEKYHNMVEQLRANPSVTSYNAYKINDDNEEEEEDEEEPPYLINARKRMQLFHLADDIPRDYENIDDDLATDYENNDDDYEYDPYQEEKALQRLEDYERRIIAREKLRQNEPKPERIIFEPSIDDREAFRRPDSIREAENLAHVSPSYFREVNANQHPEQPPVKQTYYSYMKDLKPLDVEFVRKIDRESEYTDSDEMNESLEERENAKDIERNSLLRNSLTPFEEEAMLANDNMAEEINPPKQRRVFTDSGIVYVPDRHVEEELQEKKKSKARQILESMFGFTRHERLDVKKPGPLIGPPPSENIENIRKNFTDERNAGNKEVLPAHIKNSDELQKMKKVVKDSSSEDHIPSTEYAHVIVKNPIEWEDGIRIVNELANILHMQGYFTYLTVQLYQVAFRVDSNNPEHKTAEDIARFINENRGVKNNLLRRLGVTVIAAGVGKELNTLEDEVSASKRQYSIIEANPDVTHILFFMFAGAAVAAVIVICVTVILIRRYDKKRDKLGGLQSGAGGAESCSKDYQDLCRARMAGKGNVAEPVASGRITTLSKESERPPSSRSSTSSWSEEPALTNMDISTGHMVLSYMEDHLRNKGRLQREWEALCRYEAEPSARDAAQQPQCSTFNRNGAPLPYDHSRVVLNHLANAEGLDYVNASTITDHDPRAPAYVAAQGPLPTTLAHFWQMVWEQGAVVIVSLCRLQENGEIACARYWPEEGAEVYHIYEVHLVSEHIWCDDYLVRSFYLKNLRTSETRTVTQFHFLSWPQNGVPAQAKALLDFRRKVNKSYRGRSCPIVVHGSTGAGRTGAYILLDLVLGRMNKGAREIDIAATLEHLRDQRAGLVATRQQFEFVLMAVAEEVHAILKALPANTSGEKRDAEKDGATGTLKEESGNEDETEALKSTNDDDASNEEKSKTTTATETDKNDSTKTTPAKSSDRGTGNGNGNGKGNGKGNGQQGESATTSVKKK